MDCTFHFKTLANNAITKRPLGEAELIAFISKYKISQCIVIKGIREDILLEEFKKIIEDENSNIKFSKMFRLRRRD